MPTTTEYEQLLEKALALTPEQRIQLAQELLESVEWEDEDDEDPAAVEAAWADEIKRRVEELDSGLAEPTPAAEVFARARERVRAVADAHASAR
ncbi:MAG TPA: addiction module protein [Longimicrobium sp.]|nr:addiction module protein [Longimicrobium sp.]